MGERHGRRALGGAGRVAHAEHAHAREVAEACEQTRAQRGLVALDGGERRGERVAAGQLTAGDRAAVRQIVDRRARAGEAFVVGGALHEAPRQRALGGADLLGGERLEHAALAPQDADVRAEELVDRACEQVATPSGDVDAPVRRPMHGVDEGQRALRVRGASTRRRTGGSVPIRLPAAVNATSRVRGDSAALALCRSRLPSASSSMRNLHGRAGGRGGAHPRRDVGVVVEAGDDHLVAGAPRGGERLRDVEGQRRHVRPEHDAVGVVGADERRCCSARLLQAAVGGLRRGEGATDVGVLVQQRVADSVGHDGRHLTAGGAVEAHRALSGDLAGEAWELRAHPLDVETLAETLVGTLAHPGRLRAPRSASIRAMRSVQRMLCVRRGGLGDTLLVLPILRAMRARAPAARLEFAGIAEFARLFVEFGVCAAAWSSEDLATWSLAAPGDPRASAARLAQFDWIVGDDPALAAARARRGRRRVRPAARRRATRAGRGPAARAGRPVR